MKEYRFSYGSKITQTTDLAVINLEQYKTIVTNNTKLKIDCDYLRVNLKGDRNKDARKRFKKYNLPYVCFAGTFRERSKEGLMKASGIMVIDYDIFEEDVVNVLLEVLKSNEYTLFVQKSPSGGLKQGIKIPLVKSDDEYKEYFYGFIEKNPDLDIDKTGADISRACYLSYDPNFWMNENSNTFQFKSKKEQLSNLSIPKQKKKVTKNKGVDTLDRSAHDFRFCMALIIDGKNKEDVFRILDKCGSDRWKGETIGYKELTYNNALKTVGGIN